MSLENQCLGVLSKGELLAIEVFETNELGESWEGDYSLRKKNPRTIKSKVNSLSWGKFWRKTYLEEKICGKDWAKPFWLSSNCNCSKLLHELIESIWKKFWAKLPVCISPRIILNKNDNLLDDHHHPNPQQHHQQEWNRCY